MRLPLTEKRCLTQNAVSLYHETAIPVYSGTVHLSLKSISMKKRYFVYFTLFLSQCLFSQPVISSFTPGSGPVGSTVIISGSNFNATASLNIVYFGATKAIVNNATLNSLT